MIDRTTEDQFNHLPNEAILEVVSYLSPEFISQNVVKVNKKFNDVFNNNLFWKLMFERHFPYIFKSMKVENISNWYQEFCNTYHEEYKHLSVSIRKAFSFAKGGDHVSLFPIVEENGVTRQESLITFEDLYRVDKQNIPLFDWIEEKNNQELLDHIYKLAHQWFHSEGRLDTKKIDERGRTILHWFILCHQQLEGRLDQLIKDGADINALTFSSSNAILLAAKHNQVEIVKRLATRYKANINSQSGAGATPLMFAVGKGHKNLVDLLLELGADITIPLKVNREYHVKLGIIELDTPFHAAVRLGHKDIVQSFINKGVNVNAPALNGITPLMCAAIKDQAEIADLLISSGANIDARSKVGTTALMFAVENNHRKVVNVLLDCGANITIPIKNSEYHKRFKLVEDDTPFVAAIKLGLKEIVEDFLNKRLELNATQNFSNALLFAADQGQINIVEFLINYGATRNLTYDENTIYKFDQIMQQYLLDWTTNISSSNLIPENSLMQKVLTSLMNRFLLLRENKPSVGPLGNEDTLLDIYEAYLKLNQITTYESLYDNFILEIEADIFKCRTQEDVLKSLKQYQLLRLGKLTLCNYYLESVQFLTYICRFFEEQKSLSPEVSKLIKPILNIQAKFLQSKQFDYMEFLIEFYHIVKQPEKFNLELLNRELENIFYKPKKIDIKKWIKGLIDVTIDNQIVSKPYTFWMNDIYSVIRKYKQLNEGDIMDRVIRLLQSSISLTDSYRLNNLQKAAEPWVKLVNHIIIRIKNYYRYVKALPIESLKKIEMDSILQLAMQLAITNEKNVDVIKATVNDIQRLLNNIHIPISYSINIFAFDSFYKLTSQLVTDLLASIKNTKNLELSSEKKRSFFGGMGSG